MSETLETVKIQADNDRGYVIINKSDLKESDKIYGERKEHASVKPAPKRGK